MTDLPKEFIERISRQLGNELPDFLRAMNEKPVRGIRMNLQKPFAGMDIYTKMEHIPWADSAAVEVRKSQYS